ncbi:MAG: tetratricopeptide repeat protein [Armatimonadota bacterium]
MRTILWLMLAGLLLVLAIPVVAQDDEEDDGFTLDPSLQWRMAQTTWDRREYDDAAALMLAFAEGNPDDANTLEAYWRTYEIYRAYRPNPNRKKIVFEKAIGVCERWVKKFSDNKVKAAQSRWYKALLLDREGNRQMAIASLNELVAKYPGTDLDDDAFWHLGEWLREAQRYREAIDAYAGYGKTVGVTDWAAVCLYRQAMCFEALADREGAIEAYRAVLNGGYNFGWHHTCHGGMDAARRLRALGEDELARAFALKIVDNAHPNWQDLKAQALSFLGEKANIPKFIRIYSYLNETYSSYAVNISGNTKLQVSRDVPVLVRLERTSKEDPFKGTAVFTPKVTLDKQPGNAKLSEEGGKKHFSTEIASPDDKGTITGDWNYAFSQETQLEEAPDNVTITRSSQKIENGLMNCTIRIQSTARYYIYITLPNNKTNVNNLNRQPHEVRDGGKTFLWYDWIDLSKGIDINFPAEVGGNADAFYPQVRLERNINGYVRDASGNNNTAGSETPYLGIKLTSDKSFPYAFHYHGHRVVLLNETVK